MPENIFRQFPWQQRNIQNTFMNIDSKHSKIQIEQTQRKLIKNIHNFFSRSLFKNPTLFIWTCSGNWFKLINFIFIYRSGYHNDEIYAKVDDMTYYPVNSSMILPNNSTSSTTMSHGNQQPMGVPLGSHGHLTSGLPHSGIPTPPGAPTSHMGHGGGLPPGMMGPGGLLPSGQASTKTLTMSHHHMNLLNPRPSDFHANFGTVHRSQKIYL